MKDNNLIYTPYTEFVETSRADIKQQLSKYLYHWPLFVICLAMSISIAYVYSKQLNPIYHVKAKISIRDEKAKGAGEKEAVLEQLNITTGPKLIESEVEILKSRQLIRSVVQRLGLETSYTQTTGLKKSDLYGESPITLKFMNSSRVSNTLKFTIQILDEHRFLIKGPKGESQEYTFNKFFPSKFGKWKIEKTNLSPRYFGQEITVHVDNIESTVTQYQEKIKTVFNKTVPIIELSIDEEVPKRGKDILDNLISAYKRHNIQDKNKETENTLKFIDERLVSLTAELNSVEKNVEGYKSDNGLTDISSMAQAYLDNVKNNDVRLNEVNVQLNVIDGIERYLESSENEENVPATIGITDPGLISLVEQLSRLQLQKARLLAITPENNPIFVPLNKQINSTKAAVKETVRGIKSSLLATERQYKRFNTGFEANIKNIPGQERGYVSIKRQQGIKESLYVYLLQKREEVGLRYASILPDANTVESAYYGDPVTNKKLPFAVALLSGLLIPISFIATRRALRNRVLTKSDIQEVTTVPVISELVQESKEKSIVMLNREAYALSEQIRGLRTNILQSYQDIKQGKVALCVSSIAGEGKSFVASNIAVSLAAMGQKTVILELDLRKPKISKIFNLDNTGPGLSDYLQSDLKKEDIIQDSGVHPMLFVMGSGVSPSNPAELLESEKMKTLIADLKGEFDNIIIDSPPLHLVTDAMIVAPLCDITLYIVRHNYTPKAELNFIEHLHKVNKLVNMSLVFNGIEMDRRFGYEIDYGYYADKRKGTVWSAVFSNIESRF